VQRRRDRQWRQRAGERIAPVLILEQTGFDHGLGQLLDEEGHTVSLAYDLLQHLRRQRLAAGHFGDHGAALLAAQSVERE
jgi:hypothetical protein